jgi:hypothetical protein
LKGRWKGVHGRIGLRGPAADLPLARELELEAVRESLPARLDDVFGDPDGAPDPHDRIDMHPARVGESAPADEGAAPRSSRRRAIFSFSSALKEMFSPWVPSRRVVS